MPFQTIPYFFTSKALCIQCTLFFKWSFFFPVHVSVSCVVSRKAKTSYRCAQLPLGTSTFHSHFNSPFKPHKELFKFGR